MTQLLRVLTVVALGFALYGLLPVAGVEAGEEQVRKLVIHVDENNPKRMNLALNNAENVTKYYNKKGQKVKVRIVTYGPGLHMLRKDTSPVKARIEKMALEFEEMSFAACGTTQGKMAKKEGKKPPIIDEAKLVPSGVVEIMELQQEGWAYVRP
jgi:intracellular sulfur oxidation DsrE/DsrF family protein